jgi:hypothetical protein
MDRRLKPVDLWLPELRKTKGQQKQRFRRGQFRRLFTEQELNETLFWFFFEISEMLAVSTKQISLNARSQMMTTLKFSSAM